MAMPQRVFIEFGEFAPDLKDYNHEGLSSCANWAPVHGSYVSAPTWEIEGSSWSGVGNTETLGLHTHDPDGSSWVGYMGDVTKLYKIDATTFARTDFSRLAGGAYNAAGAETGWQFVSFGQNVIATDYIDDVQLLLPGAVNFVKMAQSGGVNPGMDPKAKFVFSVRGNLFLANCSLSANFDTLASGANPTLVAWSQTDNVRQFGSVTVTPQLIGAGYQPIENDFGPITGAIGLGDFGVVFQKSAITLIEGPPYQFRTVVRGYGTRFPNSIAAVGDSVYFWSQGGPAVLRGGEVQVLGQGRWTRTLADNSSGFSNFDSIYAGIDIRGVEAFVDVSNCLVGWAYTSTPLSDTPGAKKVLYNFREDRVTFADNYASDKGGDVVPCGIVAAHAHATISEAWMPLRDLLTVIHLSGPLHSLATTALELSPESIIGRGYLRLHPSLATKINAVRPVYAGDGSAIRIDVSVDSRNAPWRTAATTGPFSTENEAGWISTPEAKVADFHRLTLTFRGDDGGILPQSIFEIKGMDVEFVTGGRYGV